MRLAAALALDGAAARPLVLVARALPLEAVAEQPGQRALRAARPGWCAPDWARRTAPGGDKRPRALGSIIAWLEPFIKSLNRPMMFSSEIKRRDRPAAKAASLLFCWLGGSDRPNACHRVSNSYQILSSPKSEQPVSTNRFCSSITCFIDACF